MRQLAARVDGPVPEELSWAWVQTEMLRLHVRRRLSEQLDGITHGPQGSLDKLLMTWVEQSVGHAALADGRIGRRRDVRRLHVQPRAERDGRHRADSEEHHRAAHSWIGRQLKCTTCQTKSTSRPTVPCASSRSTVPMSSTRSTTTCTWGWPRSGRRSTRTPARGRPSSPVRAGRSRPAVTSTTSTSCATTKRCGRRRSSTAATSSSAWCAAASRWSPRSTVRPSGWAAAWPRCPTSSTSPRPRSSPTRTCRSDWWPLTAARWCGGRRSACCRPRSSR